MAADQLKRIVLDFRTDEIVARVLYRSQDGPNPNTKARRREAQELARTGLREALASLEGGAVLVGTSGFTTREDVLLAAASPASRMLPASAKQVKGA